MTAPTTLLWRVVWRNGSTGTVRATNYGDALSRARWIAPKLAIESICLMEDEQ